MKELSRQYVSALCRQRYKYTTVYALDEFYMDTKRDAGMRIYYGFRKWMKSLGFIMWVAEKLDCDKTSILFKAYCIIRNAMNRRTTAAIPVGILCYNIGGNPGQGHCINFIVEDEHIYEIEPQAGGGLTLLTDKEKDSVWLCLI